MLRSKTHWFDYFLIIQVTLIAQAGGTELNEAMNNALQWTKIPINFLHLHFCKKILHLLPKTYFGHLMRRADSLEKTLMLGGIESRKRRGWQRMRWLDGITNQWTCVEWTLGVGDGQGGLRAAIHGVPKSCTWLSNWNELKIFFWIYHSLSEFRKPKAAKFNFSTFLSEPIDYKASALQSKMEHGFNSFKAA